MREASPSAPSRQRTALVAFSLPFAAVAGASPRLAAGVRDGRRRGGGEGEGMQFTSWLDDASLCSPDHRRGCGGLGLGCRTIDVRKPIGARLLGHSVEGMSCVIEDARSSFISVADAPCEARRGVS